LRSCAFSRRFIGVGAKLDLFFLYKTILTQNRIISYHNIIQQPLWHRQHPHPHPHPPHQHAQTECQKPKIQQINRLPVECGFCDFAAQKLLQTVYPSLTEEVKCMACKKNWDRTTVHPSLTQHTLIPSDRRENILIDRENANGGNTTRSGRIKLDRVLIAEIAEQEHEIHLIQQKLENYTETEQRNYKSSIQNVMDGGENSTERTSAKLKRSAPSTDARVSRQGNADCAATGPARVL
jgi:hypothetical protein